MFALDASTIDLCLSVFPWALFRSTKSAVKLHALLDLRGGIPTFVHVSHGKLGDVNVLDLLLPEPGTFYVMDRAYLDFWRLHVLHSAGAFFVIRAKSNTKFRRRYSREADKSAGVLCDQTVVLTGPTSNNDYPQPLRRVKYSDAETGRTFDFLTNNFVVPAATVADLYRCRWQVELFFKWIKQHLRIKSFFGTSENAVKTQIWIAVAVYVLVAIVRKRLGIDASLYTILQALSLTLFEKTPLFSVLSNENISPAELDDPNQLNLFDYLLGHFSDLIPLLASAASQPLTSQRAGQRPRTQVLVLAWVHRATTSTLGQWASRNVDLPESCSNCIWSTSISTNRLIVPANVTVVSPPSPIPRCVTAQSGMPPDRPCGTPTSRCVVDEPKDSHIERTISLSSSKPTASGASAHRSTSSADAPLECRL